MFSIISTLAILTGPHYGGKPHVEQPNVDSDSETESLDLVTSSANQHEAQSSTTYERTEPEKSGRGRGRDRYKLCFREMVSELISYPVP